MIMKEKIEDYTEEEFFDFLREFSPERNKLEGKEYGAYIDVLLQHFIKVTEHPAQSDVIFYPEEGQEDSPEGVLKVIKEWRAQTGKPGFKS
ncbi:MULTISPECIES: bacteriocin immunity protein [Pseudomonas syringae group]|uniref:bacteriocin immunity protein n=1 Tax=Pseudomonas syringae group TaxID=136849 RepID=UPI000C06F217|nr:MULTISPECIES: bacteriocin immunity protein [Pseudomonas syringae group]PHN78513.1 bacteriocin immunity protein [Pseudomonas syringae pv. cerasicola]PHN79674.1 bacteriocin immunity protein [Pseudomonas syringae pv. cerasicola]RMS69086.1 Pyocin immunity protein [Pseudomonas savastanoi]SPF17710.1 Pyocin immunity protein [Pseudomonas syringae pv. cerasicola]